MILLELYGIGFNRSLFSYKSDFDFFFGDFGFLVFIFIYLGIAVDGFRIREVFPIY